MRQYVFSNRDCSLFWVLGAKGSLFDFHGEKILGIDMSYVNKAIGYVLALFDSWLGSYLLAVLLFALAVKIVLLPLGIYQQKNMQKQASLRPKEKAIRNKYKGRENDREAALQMQNEITQMYRENKFNQFGGCLPMLIQLPFIFIIYNVIVNPLSYISNFTDEVITAIKTYVGANYEFFGLAANSIKDGVYTGDQLNLASLMNNAEYFERIAQNVEGVELTSKIPNFFLGNANLGVDPMSDFPSWLILIPVFVFLSQFFSMKLSRKLNPPPAMDMNQGCSNNIMDIGMPMLTTVMAFTFPALLGIYWIFQTLIGMLQQFILKLVLPLPTFTEEDYKRAERELNGKGPKNKNRQIDTTKKYRSLHNIDADDEDS